MFENRSLISTPLWPSRILPLTTSLSPFSSLRDDIMDLFDDFSLGMAPTLTNNEFVPKIEIKDKGNAYLVSAEVPGMSDKDMNVSIRDNNLILEGEKREEHKEDKRGFYRSELSYGSFYRSIPLTDDIDPEKVTAAYKNGVLTVTVDILPEAQQHTKKIPIAVEGKVIAKH